MDDLLKLYIDINTLCQLQEVAKSNPEARAKDILQSYSQLKTDIDTETGEPFSPIAHILRQMAKTPDVTFRHFLNKLVEGGDASSLIENVRE